MWILLWFLKKLVNCVTVSPHSSLCFLGLGGFPCFPLTCVCSRWRQELHHTHHIYRASPSVATSPREWSGLSSIKKFSILTTFAKFFPWVNSVIYYRFWALTKSSPAYRSSFKSFSPAWTLRSWLSPAYSVKAFAHSLHSQSFSLLWIPWCSVRFRRCHDNQNASTSIA